MFQFPSTCDESNTSRYNILWSTYFERNTAGIKKQSRYKGLADIYLAGNSGVVVDNGRYRCRNTIVTDAAPFFDGVLKLRQPYTGLVLMLLVTIRAETMCNKVVNRRDIR